jgi:nucleoside-diphosphate-sugar epimerase
MNVLLTGAFGNVGASALAELIQRGHTVRCFDVPTRANQKKARAFRNQMEVMWGDLRNPADVASAVRDQEAVVHLAFIIPKMSVTGVESEQRPDWSRTINVGGTCNLLDAMRAQPRPSRLIFASSYHIYGPTQDQLPPRRITDPVRPVEHYAHHKVECEKMIHLSGLQWCIFRLAATLPLALKLDPGMFDPPLNNRMEFVHTRDVGLAIAKAVSHAAVWGRTLLIGGGARCQYYYREIVGRILGSLGIGMLPERAFGTVPFATDWLDTTESQTLLSYQQRDLGDFIREMRSVLGTKRYWIWLFRPLVRQWLLSKSSYYDTGKSRRAAARSQSARANGMA